MEDCVKKFIVLLMCIFFVSSSDLSASGATILLPAQEAADPTGQEPNLSAPSVLLMEASTGTVIYEKDSHNVRPPASITKIMTLLLIFDALDNGKIQLTDEVTTSEYAASMGGSQVFLEAGETQTVDTLIKCICVASANDACASVFWCDTPCPIKAHHSTDPYTKYYHSISDRFWQK